MKSCHILWLDDDFRQDSSTKSFLESRKQSLETLLEQKGYSPTIDTVEYTDRFIQEVNNTKKSWDIFIIDILGLANESSANVQDLMYECGEAIKNKPGAAFCLTGQPSLSTDSNQSLYKMLQNCGFVPSESAPFWRKQDSIVSLANKIVECLDDEFKDYPIFREVCRYLTKDEDRFVLKTLVDWKTKENAPFPEISKLRTTLKDELIGKSLPAKLFGGKDRNFKFFDFDSKILIKGSFEDWRRYTITYLSILNTLHDNSERLAPYSYDMIFSASIALAELVVDFMQKYDNRQGSEEEFLAQYVKFEKSDVVVKQTSPIINIEKSDANTFVDLPISQDIIEGKLIYNKNNNILHVGNCVVGTAQLYYGVKNANLLKHKRCRIIEKADNNFENSKALYPYKARKLEFIDDK